MGQITDESDDMTDFQYQQASINYGISRIGLRCFKFYERGGKKFLRNYKRNVKDGLDILDLQKILNKKLSIQLAEGFGVQCYSSNKSDVPE